MGHKLKLMQALFLAGICFAALWSLRSQDYNASTGRAWYKQLNLTGQTANINTTTIFTPAADGLYRITANVTCEASGATDTALATIGYSDISNTAQTAATAAAACTTLGATSTVQAILGIQVKSGVAVTYSTTVVSAAQYALRITVEKL